MEPNFWGKDDMLPPIPIPLA